MTEGLSAERLAVRVAELEVRVAQMSNDLEDLADVATGASTPEAGVPAPLYGTLDDWVHEYFAPTFGRPIGGEVRWCAQWREHAEAIGRLEALWRSWEALRVDPAMGMATWLTNFLDPQLSSLFAKSGAFSQCAEGRHESQRALPSVSSPS